MGKEGGRSALSPARPAAPAGGCDPMPMPNQRPAPFCRPVNFLDSWSPFSFLRPSLGYGAAVWVIAVGRVTVKVTRDGSRRVAGQPALRSGDQDHRIIQLNSRAGTMRMLFYDLTTSSVLIPGAMQPIHPTGQPGSPWREWLSPRHSCRAGLHCSASHSGLPPLRRRWPPRQVGIYRRIRRGTAGGVETGIRSLLRYPDRHLTHLFVRGHQVQVVDRRGTRPLLFLP